MNKVVVDTNILIYALDESSTFHVKASAILQDENNLLFTTSKNISEYFAACSKLGVDASKILGFYEDLTQNIIFLFPNEHSLQHFQVLLKKYKPKGNRVYDIEIVSIMLANNIKRVATFNIDDFKNIEEVEIIN
jgi:predicted nucleic acid-binding protein